MDVDVKLDDALSFPGAATSANEVYNLLEAMTNLLYLARAESDQPYKVQSYLTFADDCLKRLNELLLCNRE